LSLSSSSLDAAAGEIADLLISKALLVREQILQVAAQRQQMKLAGGADARSAKVSSQQQPWIPVLSQLVGHILDAISYQVLMYSSREAAASADAGEKKANVRPFQMQEYAVRIFDRLTWPLEKFLATQNTA